MSGISSDLTGIRNINESKTVVSQRRKRKRGGIGKRRKKHEPNDNSFTFDFLNIRGYNSKSRELDRDNVDFIGLAETFLRSNIRPTKLDDRYEWVGKCRSNGKDKGGLGMCINNRITILDDNLISSRDDKFERFWTLLKINGVKTALGVTYFPNDGTDKEKTDELFHELLENVSKFSSSGYEVICMGDFNGRCVTKCTFTNKNIQSEEMTSYNGNRLVRFVEASQLHLANTLNCCTGMFTRIQGDQRSCLDYVLVSDNLKKWISSVFIDEEGELDLYSDHVIVRTVFKPRVYIKSNVSRPDFIWKVNDSTD